MHNHHIQPAWPAETHVAIVGAGPAGCVTALACAEQGLEVLLLEAREKVTERFGGEWLHPAGLKVLQRHGVGVHGPEHHSVPARGFAVIPEAGGEPIVLDYPREQAAVCIEHGRLIAALWEVVASHPKINFVHATRVAKLEPESAGVKLISESGRICHARRLVGADGRHSIVRTSLGQSAPPRTVSYTAGIRMEGVRLPIEGHGHVCLGGLGPVLMYQLGEQSVRACFDVPSAHMHTRNLAALLWDAYCPVVPASMHQAFLDALRHKPILWAANQHHPRTYAGDANRALVGDAAGCFHPLTAVGMTLGFLDGECLARCRSLAAYQTERLAESRVPATLAQALYKVFSGHSEDAVTVRRSVLELWRTSPAERERTMRLLSGEDARTLSFGAALLKVFSLAIRENSSGRPLGERLKLPVRMLAGFRPDTAGLESDGFHPLVAHDTKSAAAIGADEPRKPMGEQGESVDASTALERATDALIAHQSPSGNWEGEVVWSSMLGAQYALTHALLGRPLSASQRDALLRDFHSTQLPSGGWGMHPCSEPYLFNTALVYVASRLVGMDQDAPMLQRARAWIQAQGGVGAIPTWGKFWLALFNLYSWEGINPLLPEAWALPRWMPVHPGNFYCHTRLIYAGMSAIYASKHQMPLSPLLEEIRKELYLVPYSEIPFPRLAGQIRSAEVVMPPSRRLRFCFRLARVFERNHSAKLRRKVLEKLHDEIRFDLGQTDYGSISPVSGLLNIIALWLRDARDPDVERALAALRRWTWEDERGLRVAGATSANWDTALALQALQAAPQGSRRPGAMRRAADFLSRQQLDSNPPAMRAHHRMNPSGGYCFSARWHGWPVSDCTAEATLALLGIRTDDFHHDPSRHAAAARFILQMQNPDGGFGSYERRKTSWSLNWLNSAEMFDNSVTETSYVECTASCVRALVALRPIMSGPLLAECDRAVRRAARFLLRHQHVSGMWQGEWGVHCIYGTLFGLLGLSAALHSVHAPAIRKACRWLAAQQLPDGGWGEDHAGCIQRRFIPLESGRVVQTSWALIALLEVRWPDWEVIERGAGHLVSTLSSDGLWPKQEPAGVFFRSALLDYTLYRQIFPLWALGLYQQRRMERSRLDS